ncbi:MAG: MaoC/PaaZ C-terminal domain-containing protein [Thermodesulfobacteriota bacterium]
MPEVDLSVVGRWNPPVTYDYTFKEVVLYALGVGAGPEDLNLVYEGAPGGLKVLPSFCVVPAMKTFPAVGKVEWSRFLHGEHQIRLHRPLAPEGRLVQRGRVAAIYDKGKGAVYHIEIEGRDGQDRPAYDVEWVVFYVGAGGFGGDPGPKVESVRPPERPADFSLSQRVAANQAAIYRLSGDLNPLHIDPAAAQRGGFALPILHGLCTYGMAVRAVVKKALGGDPERLKQFGARFSAPVLMGDELLVEGWREGGRIIVQASTGRGPSLTNGLALVD